MLMVSILFSVAFYNVDAAAEWNRLSCQLDALYSARSSDAKSTAMNVSSVMADMAKLLPYACSKAVQRLLRVALLDVNLATEGHYVLPGLAAAKQAVRRCRWL